MMLKVGSEYLDFNGTVELEQKVKLFENLDSSDGDVSFQFDVEETSKNIRLLNYPVADHLTKSTYRRINCDLQDDSGVSLQVGFLRIERRVKRDRIALSFFSGNSNWFALISGKLSELDMSEFDTEQTEANVIASWNNTEGVVYPLVDNGPLLTRSYAQIKLEDLVPAIYVKTVFKKIFQSVSIKLTGELFEDPAFIASVTMTNPKNNQAILDRSTFVRTTNSPTAHGSSTYVKMTWTDDTSYPYYDGNTNNFSLVNGRYTADVPMVVNLEWVIYDTILPGIGFFAMDYYINGLYVFEKVYTSSLGTPLTLNKKLFLNAGDYVEAFVNDDAQVFSDPLTNSTWKITPIFVYKSFGSSTLPDWDKQTYVSNIFQMFNVITSFDPKTKTLTCNLFDKIKDKEPIDISKYVNVEETDYESFISSFGKRSLFRYNHLDYDEVKEYNLENFFRYGDGVIEVNNDFIPENEDIIDLDLSAPFTYINSIFGMSIERTNLIELEEDEGTDAASVSEVSTKARFNISENIFIVGDLVRISDSNNPSYNGDFTVSDVDTGWVEFDGLLFESSATATLTRMLYVYNEDDNVFIFIYIPSYQLVKFTSNEFILLGTTPQPLWGLAYFAIIDSGLQINIDYKQSLSFGEIEDPLFYQRTILETYWSLVSRVLNDPVKLINTGLMPTNVYRSIDFLRPLMVKTLESSNLYYCNTISGYKSSYENFRIDTIKLP